MAEGSCLTAEIDFQSVPVIPEIHEYLALNAIPGGTKRNWKSYGHKVSLADEHQKNILCDPQTSGGLLVAVEAGKEGEVEALFEGEGQFFGRIGVMKAADNSGICIEVR
jgi:selenide,water dikinase